jgi:PhzF family phenazine biosynthesis protein
MEPWSGRAAERRATVAAIASRAMSHHQDDFFQIDAFADGPFQGNPAAVCLLDGPRDDEFCQRMAAEMNLSETAYVWPADGGGRFHIRWFTPQVEVSLCGHATLASAGALWLAGRARSEEVAFESASGELRARRDGELVELDFPRRDAERASPPPGLLEALGVMPVFVGRSRERDYLVEVDDESVVREMRPDLATLGTIDARGVIVTARGSGRFDFVSRFFAPASGVPEDPVTGSAHCTLAPFWAARLRKDDLLAYQASARGGVVRVRVRGDRVLLAGRAVLIVSGRLAV